MYNIDEIKNSILNGDSLEQLKLIPSNSIDMCITSPPYWTLRDYEDEKQLGTEKDYKEYINKLICIFDEVYRVLKTKGSCWVNIGDVYSSNNKNGIKKHSLMGIPDRFKIEMIDRGWICRNEIIWHKPNAMPSSAKTRFNNDYEKMFFFTKDDLYYFNTQYEEAITQNKTINNITNKNKKSKYKSIKHESSVRQGMNKERGNKIIIVRPNLPTQKEFVEFIRSKTSIKILSENSDIKKSKIEHWFRKDEKGFSFPTIDDWNSIKWLIDDYSKEFNEIDNKLNYTEFETDDINKNSDKGRIKRAVWSINTKPFKGCHFAPYPQELVKTPIKACCPNDGIVLDIFLGSGTTSKEAKEQNKNYIGIEINKESIEVAKKRIGGYNEK